MNSGSLELGVEKYHPVLYFNSEQIRNQIKVQVLFHGFSLVKITVCLSVHNEYKNFVQKIVFPRLLSEIGC